MFSLHLKCPIWSQVLQIPSAVPTSSILSGGANSCKSPSAVWTSSVLYDGANSDSIEVGTPKHPESSIKHDQASGLILFGNGYPNRCPAPLFPHLPRCQ